MSTIKMLLPAQKAIEADGSIHRDFFRWLGLLTNRVNAMLGYPLSVGVLIENVTLTVGVENLVPHGLGVQFKSWYPADVQGAAMIYRYTASTADLTTYLPLLTTATVTTDIAVFPS